MKCRNPRHYARLLCTQKLIKARDEADLSATRHEANLLEEENSLLSTMLQQGAYADFVNPLLIAQRMERNHKAKARLDAQGEDQIKAWQQSSQRVDLLDDRYRQARAAQERDNLADLLAEYVTGMLTGSFSSGPGVNPLTLL